MRASLGVRFGPLYIGTGNLLKSSRGSRKGPSATEVFIVWPIVGISVLLIVVFYALPAWLWEVATSKRRKTTAVGSGEPTDDPAWAPRGAEGTVPPCSS